MAKAERQRRSLKSDDFLFDSEASLLDQQDFDMSSCAFDDVFNSKESHMEQITFLKNVQVLLEAARFLESAERKDGSELIRAAFDPVPFFLSDFKEEKKIGNLIVNSLRQQKGFPCIPVRNKHSLWRFCKRYVRCSHCVYK